MYCLNTNDPASAAGDPDHRTPCNSVQDGYQCQPDTSHFWGQYSPYFTVPSEINAAIPKGCNISFAQVLSRHGARFPTASKSAAYNRTISKIKSTAKSYDGPFAFLADYDYTLEADELTTFGKEELFQSGIKFFERYQALTKAATPFIRASGQSRVIVSAQKFVLGYNSVRGGNATLSLIIPEAAGSNNTLNGGLCPAFDNGYDSKIGGYAQGNFSKTFVPSIMKRAQSYLPGTNLTYSDVISLMDLCPYETVASKDYQPLAPFCALFTTEEWHSYDYYQTLGKFYGPGPGNPLGPTQGVGFTNELIARLIDKPVRDHTSTNTTLDSDPATFPLGRALYADFSHDNDITSIFSAMGLYKATAPLSNSTIENTKQTNGYSAAWTVPFGARAYVEKMKCHGNDEEFVRVLVNDRVIQLQNCGADKLRRCKLSKFVESLSFSREGGNWDQCFT